MSSRVRRTYVWCCSRRRLLDDQRDPRCGCDQPRLIDRHIPAAVMAMQLGKRRLLREAAQPLRLRSPAAARVAARDQEWRRRWGRRSTRPTTTGASLVELACGTEGHRSGHRVPWLQCGTTWSGRTAEDTPPVPKNIHWDLWLGIPRRPYHKIYQPANWRRWWDFGSGTLG